MTEQCLCQDEETLTLYIKYPQVLVIKRLKKRRPDVHLGNALIPCTPQDLWPLRAGQFTVKYAGDIQNVV